MENQIQISLKDNQSFDNAYELSENEIITEKQIPEEYWHGIRDIYDINNLINQHKIISIPPQNKYKNSQIFERINDKLYTYNWVGVISNFTEDGTNYRVDIRSRFDEGEKQYFLLYLLSNVLGMNIFDINIESEEESDYTCILILLFLHKVVDAYADGLYKEYVRNRYNNYDFKGVMDISRHIKVNNPFVGKTAYLTREFSYDNEILCLLRQAIDYIVDWYPDLWNGYLKNNSVLNEVIEVFEMATPSYRINENYSDMIKCRREITHPMYKKYEDARKLALMILQEAGQNVFDQSDEESLGILIDISWLWEEFIAIKLLDEEKYLHMLTNRTRGSLQWSDGEHWYPDFIERDEKKARRNVFDAKYKYWKWNKDPDVHQLLSYLFLTGGEVCGVIYPSEEGENNFKSKKLNAFENFYTDKATIYKMPFIIPQSKDYMNYAEYYNAMEKSVNEWKKKFESECIKFG